MVEQSHSCECHCHTILIACLDNIVITDRSAGFSNILNTALVSTLDIVTEGEECIRAQSYIIVLCKPFLLLS